MEGVFHALADPTRRHILELLARRDRTAGEIAAECPMAFSSVSHHLSVLKQADLVTATREGQTIRYRLNTTVAHEAAQYLMKVFARKPRA